MLSPQQIIELIRTKVDRPASARELAQLLCIPRDERAGFKRHLKTLVASGDMVKVRGGRYATPGTGDLSVGRLQTHPQGYGFVVPDHPAQDAKSDIYIPAWALGGAVHGDRVAARIDRRKPDGLVEGRIVKVLERGTARLVGRFDADSAGLSHVVPFDRRILTDISVPAEQMAGARPGDMVTVEIVRWPTQTRNAAGRVIEVLGSLDTPGVDVEIIIRKHGIPDAHSAAAVEEARRLGREVRPIDFQRRTNFRDRLTVTIDGEHARDFDDAVSIERLSNGRHWLAVHIADVSHYVEEGSALDVEAYERGTSVYFPERAVHMFPAELATGLCSLNPGVDRLVQSCVMEIDQRGDVQRYAFHDGVICSHARMTYTEVDAILAERDPATIARYQHLVPMFELMHELFEVLNRRRRARGSIDFDLPESEVVLSEAGLVEAIIPSERNVAHRIIEEFMLLANEIVARHLAHVEAPALFRVHEEPDPLRVEQFEEFVSGLGLSLGVPPDGVRPEHFQKLVERIRGTPVEKPIAFLMLRTMQRARYDAANLGHFGLAARDYTHFTSPIRRYPDLVVHRILREVRGGPRAPERVEELAEEIPEVARHASAMERRADDAERELLEWKKVRFMADKVGEEYEGYVTGVVPFGLFIEMAEHFVEGLVHISTMADDYYRYLEASHTLRGETTKKAYRLGEKVRVQVLRVDMERRQIDLGLVEILETVRQDERRRGPRRSRARPKRSAAVTSGRGPRKRSDRRRRR